MRHALALLAALLLLTGCGSAGDNVGDKWGTHPQRLPDGRTVDCVVWDGYKKGGISCDWGHAR